MTFAHQHYENRSDRIDAIRLTANFLVVFIHSFGFLTYVSDWQVTSDGPFWAWFFDASRIAMPTFFFVSGYLLFKNYSAKTKIKSRVKRLLVPYFSWCLIYLVLFFLQQMLGQVKDHSVEVHIQNQGIFRWCFKNLFSLSSDPACPPMWYVRAVFIYTLVSPLVYLMMKTSLKRITLWVLVLAWSGYMVFSGLDSNCWTSYPCYSIISFVLGCFLSDGNYLERDFGFKARIGLIVIGLASLLGCKYVVNELAGGALNPSGMKGCLIVIMRVLQPCLLFGMSDVLARCYRRYKIFKLIRESSFFLYALHYGLLVLLKPIVGGGFNRTLPVAFLQHGGLSLMCLTGFVVCVISSCIVWAFSYKLSPRMTSILDGTLR